MLRQVNDQEACSFLEMSNGFYIGQGLRVDLERFQSETITALIASLKRRGVSDELINEALSEVTHR